MSYSRLFVWLFGLDKSKTSLPAITDGSNDINTIDLNDGWVIVGVDVVKTNSIDPEDGWFVDENGEIRRCWWLNIKMSAHFAACYLKKTVLFGLGVSVLVGSFASAFLVASAPPPAYATLAMFHPELFAFLAFPAYAVAEFGVVLATAIFAKIENIGLSEWCEKAIAYEEHIKRYAILYTQEWHEQAKRKNNTLSLHW